MIKLILTIFHSKRDRSGNVYWAFHATDPQTCKTVCGTISGGESNILAAARFIAGDKGYYYSVVEEPKRQFKNHTADFGYAGCNSEYQIARFIKEGLGWEIKREDFKIVAVRDPKPNEGRTGKVYYVVSDSATYRILFDHEVALPIGQRISVTDECFDEIGARWARKVTGKLFKVASVSGNANSFGLHGHILVALDGEAWQVGRHIGDWLDAWNKGAIIETSTPLTWASHNCEIPHKLTDAPAEVVKEIWS